MRVLLHLFTISLAFLFNKTFAIPPKEYEPNKIYVHFFPTSHNDVGWLSTAEEYYAGRRDWDGLYKNVSAVLSGVTEQMLLDSNKTFTYSEMKFFKMWWSE